MMVLNCVYNLFMNKTATKGYKMKRTVQGQMKAIWSDGEGSHGPVYRNHYGESKNAYGNKRSGQGGRTMYLIQAKDLMVGDQIFVENRETPIKITTTKDTYLQEMEFWGFNPVTGEEVTKVETKNYIRINKERAIGENAFVWILAVKRIGTLSPPATHLFG